MDSKLQELHRAGKSDPNKAVEYLINIQRSGTALVAKFVDVDDLPLGDFCRGHANCFLSNLTDHTNLFSIIAPLDTIPYRPGSSILDLLNKDWMEEIAKAVFEESNFWDTSTDFHLQLCLEVAAHQVPPETVFLAGVPANVVQQAKLMPPYLNYLEQYGTNKLCVGWAQLENESRENRFLGVVAGACIVTLDTHEFIESSFRKILSHFCYSDTPAGEQSLNAAKAFRNAMYLDHQIAFLDNQTLRLV